MRHGVLTASVILSVLLSSAGTVICNPADSDKIAPVLRKLSPDTETNVIVIRQRQNRPAPPLVLPQQAAADGSSVAAEHARIGQTVVSIKAKHLAAIAANPSVVSIVPVRPLGSSLTTAYTSTNAYVAPSYGLTGDGVGVAVIDSGVSAHGDLKSSTCGASRVVYNESFVPGDPSTADAYGHGTHVAGIIAGNGACSGTSSSLARMTGIAPAARIINLRVLNAFGLGTDASTIAAIDRAIQLKTQYNIRVINLSLGRIVYESYRNDALCNAVEAATAAGILVVVSAGNSGQNNLNNLNGYGSIHSPGNDPYVLTVGAINMKGTTTRADDAVASFSSKGPSAYDRILKPDLVAPGNRVGAALASGSRVGLLYPSLIVGGGYPSGKYISLSGTSMAAPMAAGAAALIFQANPTLTPAKVKARLMRTAHKGFSASSTVVTSLGIFTTYHDTPTIGAGYLDIAAALADSNTSSSGGISPKTSASSSGTIIRLSDPSSPSFLTNWVTAAPSLYGTINVQSDTLLGGWGKAWGDPSVAGYSILWGDTVLWGDSILWGESILWGDTVLWGESILQGE